MGFLQVVEEGGLRPVEGESVVLWRKFQSKFREATFVVVFP